MAREPSGEAREHVGSVAKSEGLRVDSEVTLEELKARVARFRDERNWAQFHNPKDLAISIAIEAAELLELFQWKNAQETANLLADSQKAQRIREELADIVIYCLSAADGLGFDLSDAVVTKIRSNAEKYPVQKSRNSAAKYTEL